MVELKYSDDDTPLLSSSHFDDTGGISTSKARTKCQGQLSDASVKDGNQRTDLRGAEYRSKVLRSIAMCMCNFSVGLATGVMGPAILDLQIITQTTVQQASAFLTASAAGSMVGSALSGFLYDFFNKDVLMVTQELLLGLMILVIPFCSLYWLMIGACFLLNVFRMCTALSANAEVFRTWGTQGPTFVQALHFGFSFGGMISPLIAEPFLASSDSNSTSVLDRNNHTDNLDPDFDLDTVTDAIPDGGVPDMTTTRIHFAFVICSMMCLLISLFLVLECLYGRKIKASRHSSGKHNMSRGQNAQNGGLAAHGTTRGGGGRDSQENTDGEEERNTAGVSDEKPNEGSFLITSGTLTLPLLPYIVVMLWVGVFFCTFIGSQYTVNYYLASYAVLQLQWTKSQAAFLSSVFWIFMGLSRFSCIFVSKCLTPVKLLVLAFAIWIPSQVAFVFMSLYGVDWGIWLCSALLGTALSPVYASFFSWLNANLVASTGKVNSYIGVASQTGATVSLTVLGNIIENDGAIWFVYVMLGEAILTCLTFVSLLFFTRLYLQPRYNTGREVVITYSATYDESTSTILR